MRSLSILLVEDSPLFRSALANVLAHNKTFNVSLTGCTSNALVARTRKLNQDVAVIDTVTWAGGHGELIETVRRVSSAIPVILLGREELLDRYSDVIRAGAAGFVKQTVSPGLLMKAVTVVAQGGVWFDRNLFRRIFVQLPSIGRQHRNACLSPREQQILDFIANGRTNKEIGTLLGLTERTIKACVSNLLRKLNAPNRSALTSYALSNGLIRLRARSSP